jgi:hypothetical protein
MTGKPPAASKCTTVRPTTATDVIGYGRMLKDVFVKTTVASGRANEGNATTRES